MSKSQLGEYIVYQQGLRERYVNFQETYLIFYHPRKGIDTAMKLYQCCSSACQWDETMNLEVIKSDRYLV